MIQNTNDIYDLIKSPRYSVLNYPKSSVHGFYTVIDFNTNEKIVVKLGLKNIEIRKSKNMNFEYYEEIPVRDNVSRLTYKQFKTLLAKKICNEINARNK